MNEDTGLMKGDTVEGGVVNLRAEKALKPDKYLLDSLNYYLAQDIFVNEY